MQNMIVVAMYMKVPPGKRKELSQAIVSMLNSIRKKKGCVSCDFFHGMENENLFCLFQEWDSMKDFAAFRESENYKVLQGAMHLLSESCEILVYQHLQTSGKLPANEMKTQR